MMDIGEMAGSIAFTLSVCKHTTFVLWLPPPPNSYHYKKDNLSLSIFQVASYCKQQVCRTYIMPGQASGQAEQTVDIDTMGKVRAR